MSRRPVVPRYGHRRDRPDTRDHRYAPRLDAPLPSAVDLRPGMPPVYDQGRIGSCTANALAAAVEFDLVRQGLTDFVPSRLFIYYNERAAEGTTADDSGAQLRDGLRSLATVGVCPETLWPYDDTPALGADGPFPDGSLAATRPPQACYDSALSWRATLYQSVVQETLQLKACLAEGYPFVLGFSVYAGFESDAVAATGTGQMPQSGEKQLGAHAVVGVGYSDLLQRWILRNSWSARWGDGGYFTLPYAYLEDPDLASDFWTVRMIA